MLGLVGDDDGGGGVCVCTLALFAEPNTLLHCHKYILAVFSESASQQVMKLQM